jgi:hypothetical protein
MICISNFGSPPIFTCYQEVVRLFINQTVSVRVIVYHVFVWVLFLFHLVRCSAGDL